MKTQLIILFLILGNVASSQSDSISENHFIIPKDINYCISEIDNVFTTKAKDKLKSLTIDTLGYLYDVYIIDEWLHQDSSRLKKYFSNLGLQFEYEMEYFILLSYYKYLWTGHGDISRELKCYVDNNDSIKRANQKECDSLRNLDTIDRQYIPKNLLDCYLQLDLLLCDSVKAEIKTSNDLFNYHFSLGLWIRNNMGLWTCSKFSDYFHELKIRNPDDMSGIIIEGYKLYLNGKACEFNDLISMMPPVPPPAQLRRHIKFKVHSDKKKDRFIRKRRIDNFEISEFTMIKIKICT